ncbi:hypothetical protein [Arthrobacter sp. ov118]|uniref:hypothetical protein n=1 Tax=Arthrobacter sp. ov118 TaxID=1761747 RepID=UPI0008E1B561|nr:hypothetical protein [Arthrobacter sp. ov118]SFT54696.1 hypothetical protein SAMN04487915_101869 [Arthrobacter sp. ov118]
MTNPDHTNSSQEVGAVSHEGTESGPTTAALTTGLVSYRQPDGLILSTGNLYFTSHDANFGTVWRMAQSAVPGQEILLHAELGARFGDIVFAQVGGAFFGYFFATHGGATVTIERIPLAGGAATVLATLTNIDVFNNHRNLVTDGVNLYWQDVSSVRKMPIGGGAITVLDPSQPNTPTAGVALQGANLIYASVNDIRFVPTAGTAITTPSLRTIVTAASRVTALHVVSNGVYWGEQGGAVKLKVGSTITTLPSSAGLPPTSISSNGFTAGGAQAWSQCGSSSCFLHFVLPSGNFSSVIGSDALGVSVTSAGNVFWGDAAGVHRQIF